MIVGFKNQSIVVQGKYIHHAWVIALSPGSPPRAWRTRLAWLYRGTSITCSLYSVKCSFTIKIYSCCVYINHSEPIITCVIYRVQQNANINSHSILNHHCDEFLYYRHPHKQQYPSAQQPQTHGCTVHAAITRYGSTLCIGIAMIFVFSPYIGILSYYFHFQVILMTL